MRTTTSGDVRPDGIVVGLGPSDLQHAYQIDSALGAGATVAIVDAFDDPGAEADLATYRANYGLAPCTTANGCFRKVNQADNASPPPARDLGWELEISLDLDAVSAACPSCHILLVEASSASFADLAAAVNTAARLGATVISNSYGGPEFSGETSFDSAYNHPGIGVFVSTGDDGFGVEYPAASQFVTAVGGTTVAPSTTAARGWVETAWSGAGSGCSAFEPKPSWQHDSGCPRRSLADVSAVADPLTGLGVFDSGNGGWLVVGGTSLSTPVVASIYAATGEGVQNGLFSYGNLGAFFDITAGNNGPCGTYLCNSGAGYDGPTGNGAPRGSVMFPLAHPQLDQPEVFDPNFYLALYPDLRAMFGTNLAAARNHWLTHGIDEGRHGSPEFDSEFYLSRYGDLRNAFGATGYRAAMNHFIIQGLPAEGRRGSPEFDVTYYLAHNGDLQNAFHNNFAAAMNHFIIQGLPIEGRRGSLEFDVTYYADHPGDVRAMFGNNYTQATFHWFSQGLPVQGRQASPDFNVGFYLSSNPDLQAAFGATNYYVALNHWIDAGMAQGRKGVP